MAGGVNQFVKERGVIALRPLEPLPRRQADAILTRRIEGACHAVLDERWLRHVRDHILRLADAVHGCLHWRCAIFKSVALRQIEDMVKTEQPFFLLLAGFLVLKGRLFPKDDRTRFFSLAHGSTKLQCLPEREPEG